jgi:hypothetical protein
VAKLLMRQKSVKCINFWVFFNTLSHTSELHMQHTKKL